MVEHTTVVDPIAMGEGERELTMVELLLCFCGEREREGGMLLCSCV